MAESTTTTAAWTIERTPAANALPVISAARGRRGDHELGQHARVALPDDLDGGAPCAARRTAARTARRSRAGQRGVGGQQLRHVADHPADPHRAVGGVDAEHADRCPPSAEQRGQHPDGGGLARAVRAEQAERLAWRDAQVTWSTAVCGRTGRSGPSTAPRRARSGPARVRRGAAGCAVSSSSMASSSLGQADERGHRAGQRRGRPGQPAKRPRRPAQPAGPGTRPIRCRAPCR